MEKATKDMSFVEWLFTPSAWGEEKVIINTTFKGIEELYDLKVIMDNHPKKDGVSTDNKKLINQTIFDAVRYTQEQVNPLKLSNTRTSDADREAIKAFDEFKMNTIFDIESIKIDRVGLAVTVTDIKTITDVKTMEDVQKTTKMEEYVMQTFTEVLQARVTENPAEMAILGNVLQKAVGGSKPLPQKESLAAEKSFVAKLANESTNVSTEQKRGA